MQTKNKMNLLYLFLIVPSISSGMLTRLKHQSPPATEVKMDRETQAQIKSCCKKTGCSKKNACSWFLGGCTAYWCCCSVLIGVLVMHGHSNGLTPHETLSHLTRKPHPAFYFNESALTNLTAPELDRLWNRKLRLYLSPEELRELNTIRRLYGSKQKELQASKKDE